MDEFPLEQEKYSSWVEPTTLAGVHSGPNGPAILTSHIDALAAKLEGLDDLYIKFMTFVKAPFLKTFQSCVEHTKKEDFDYDVQTGRIVYVPEAGGKTRIIAVLDFWTQRLLRPIHLGVMNLLRSLPMDGTFNQNLAFNRAKIFSKDHSMYSFDLSSATDRFPIEPQTHVVKLLFGTEISDFWTQMLVNRDYWLTEKNNGKRKKLMKVRWAVGQPLGAYSSWAVFSLTHHYFVQFCYYESLPPRLREKYKLWDFKDYSILGDDVCIWNSNVSNIYQDSLNQMDVPINKEKSILTVKSEYRVGEFCKRIFMNGIELSPLSINSLLSIRESLYNLPGALEMITERWSVPDSILESWVRAEKVFTKKTHLLDIILGFRHLVNGRNSFPWCQFDRESTLEGLRLHLIGTFSIGYSFITGRPTGFDPEDPFKGVIKKVSQLKEIFDKHGIGLSNNLLPDKPLRVQVKPTMRPYHPIVEAYQDMCAVSFEQNFDWKIGKRPSLDDDHKVQINYFKRTRTTSLDLFFLKTKRRRVVMQTAMAVKWYYALKQAIDSSTDSNITTSRDPG